MSCMVGKDAKSPISVIQAGSVAVKTGSRNPEITLKTGCRIKSGITSFKTRRRTVFVIFIIAAMILRPYQGKSQVFSSWNKVWTV